MAHRRVGQSGEKYRATRHNLGFLLIDRLAAEAGLKVTKTRAQARIGWGRLAGREATLAKPQTYMNLSGQSVVGLVKGLGIDSQKLIVAHDDLDLGVGRLKLVQSSGPGGHKGVASIIDHLGSTEFIRLKMGIGRPDNPRLDPRDYVLQSFGAEEKEAIDAMLERAVEAVKMILTQALGQAQSLFNRPETD